MGYFLSIGEFKYEVDADDRYVWLTVENADHPDAPLNSSAPEGYTDNSISPSYTAWTDFTKRQGLFDVFFDKSNYRGAVESDWNAKHPALLAQHPGVAALTPDHLRRFREAQEAYNPAAPGDPHYTGDGIDWDKRRLDWLVWWTDWALKNCKYPTFANS